MVSKTLLACLAVLASISMVQATSISPCVHGTGFLNAFLGLRIDLGGLLSGVLNVAKSVINGVLNLVSGLLNGLLNGNDDYSTSNLKHIPAPTDLNQLLQVLLKIGTVYDTACQKQFGSGWTSGIVVDVYLNILNLLKVQLNLGNGSSSSYLSGADLETCKSQVKSVLASLEGVANWESSQFAQLRSNIEGLFNLINTTTIDVDLYLEATIKYINIQVELITMAGYPSDSRADYVKSLVDSCNAALVNVKVDVTLSVSDISTGSQQACGCLVKS